MAASREIQLFWVLSPNEYRVRVWKVIPLRVQGLGAVLCVDLLEAEAMSGWSAGAEILWGEGGVLSRSRWMNLSDGEGRTSW